MGIARPKRQHEEKISGLRPQDAPAMQYADYQAGREFVDEMLDGDTEKAERLLRLLESRDVAELRASVKAWLSLVDSAGSSERAQRVLATMRGSGAIL
jgi:hypothetical protein